MAIAALAVWAFTVAAGAYLLTHVIAAKRAADSRRYAPGEVPGAVMVPASTVPAPTEPAQTGPAQTGPAATSPAPLPPAFAGPAAPTPRAASSSPAALPPIPRVKVRTGPDDHPLREFSHPALGLCGLACWLAFTATHDVAFAWIACGVLAATAGVGLSWLAGYMRAARRRGGANAGLHGDADPDRPGAHGPGTDQPGAHGPAGHQPSAHGPGTDQPSSDRQRISAHLVAVHGLAAATTIALVAATVVTAAHT